MRKLHYTMLVCAITVLGVLFIVTHPKQAAAESTPGHFAEQTQINELVSIAIPPYKW
ncbi:hypothetical protein D3C72_106410 [compost metagenome]